MKIFIISSDQNTSDEYKNELKDYVESLENKGHRVYFPYRDTLYNNRDIDIHNQERISMIDSDEIHIFYCASSSETHFKLGMAFMLNKKIKVVSNESLPEGKGFPRFLIEWEDYKNTPPKYYR